MLFQRLRNFSLQQLVSKLSVRGRIAAIAVIPVVGFLANGLAFTAGESEVGNAFESVKSAAVLAATVRGTLSMWMASVFRMIDDREMARATAAG